MRQFMQFIVDRLFAFLLFSALRWGWRHIAATHLGQVGQALERHTQEAHRLVRPVPARGTMGDALP
jgi:hypothetical protein